MASSRKRQKPSLFRRLIYFLLFLSGGSAGLGGWVLKDHPRVQAIWTLVTGKPADEIPGALDGSLVADAISALKAHEDFRQPGTYRVAIKRVELDPALFRAGHTVDIQTSVHRVDAQGRDVTVWDSRTYGERLAVVGKDELSAGWANRPFDVEWKPGDRLVLEVSDRKTGLFAEPRRFTLAGPLPAAREFPLKSGDYPLATAPRQRPGPAGDAHESHVVLQSQRAGDIGHQRHTDVAERPIVIK
jgi:hypothetical protein